MYEVAVNLLNGKISRTVQTATSLNFTQVFNGFAHAFTKELDRQHLRLEMGRVILAPFMTVRDGVERGATATLKAPIKFTLINAPVTSLYLVLAIGAPRAEAYGSTVLGELGDLVQTYGLDHTTLSINETKIVVSTLDSIHLTPDEIRLLTPQLAQIALDALKHAAAQGLAFGQRPRPFQDLMLNLIGAFTSQAQPTLPSSSRSRQTHHFRTSLP